MDDYLQYLDIVEQHEGVVSCSYVSMNHSLNALFYSSSIIFQLFLLCPWPRNKFIKGFWTATSSRIEKVCKWLLYIFANIIRTYGFLWPVKTSTQHALKSLLVVLQNLVLVSDSAIKYVFTVYSLYDSWGCGLTSSLSPT